MAVIGLLLVLGLGALGAILLTTRDEDHMAAGKPRPSASLARVPERWSDLSAELAAPWPKLQRRNGRFPDYVDRYIKGLPDTRYGEAMLGLALIRSGWRRGDRPAINAGMRALAYVATRPAGRHHRPSVFEDMAMASGWNFARRKLGSHPTFQRVKKRWKGFLRKIYPISTPYRRPQTRRYSNHYLVEAITVLELLNSGVHTKRSWATIGGKRGHARRITIRLLNKQIPRFASRDRVTIRGEPTFILSDPPDNPLAYQGFSVGFYARALKLLGKRTSGRARAALRGAVNASIWLTAPDGSSGYFGRSQEEAWSLTAAANGAETAARLPGSGKGRDARYHALTERALSRLQTAYGVGPQGLNLVPAMRQHPRLGARGLDVNAGAPSFSGITLLNLDWAMDEMPKRRPLGRIAADGPLAVRLSHGESRFAVVRRGRSWFAVRQTRSARREEDLRYDFGLVALKTRTDGGWVDVLRIRPRQVDRQDSAGPILMRGGAAGLPFGRSLRVNRRGTVTVVGGFRTRGGKLLRSGVRFRFQPTACGVRIVWPARRGDRYVLSLFMRKDSKPRVLSPFAIGDADQIVRFNSPTTVGFRGGYASAIDPLLSRARATIRAKQSKSMRVTVCKPG